MGDDNSLSIKDEGKNLIAEARRGLKKLKHSKTFIQIEKWNKNAKPYSVLKQ